MIEQVGKVKAGRYHLNSQTLVTTMMSPSPQTVGCGAVATVEVGSQFFSS